jgi:CIC family chloride channel protein
VDRVWQTLRGVLQARGAAAFLTASLAVGVLVGGAAALMVLALGWVRDLVGEATDRTGTWVVVLAVPAGMVTSWMLARRFGEEVEGGGVTESLMALSVHTGFLSSRSIVPKIAATAITLGSGGSGGREGPAVLIGGAIGSSLARYTRFGEDQIRSLVAAGAGAGIGATFGAPIAGMLFALEILLQNFAVRHLNSVVVASVAAAVTTRSIVGEERLLRAPSHAFRHPSELVLYALLGLVAVAAALAFHRVIELVGRWRSGARYPDWLRPVVMGGVVGLFGLVELDALGTGQEFVAELLRLTSDTSRAWWPLLVVALAKIVTNAITRSGGGSGGTFMPSLFVGAAIGSAMAIVVGPVWGFSDLDPGAFAVVGMAATFAATGRAPLTAILIVFEITGDYGLVLPLMLSTSLAVFLTDRFQPESLYTAPLARKGIHLVRSEDIDLLDTVTVGEVMTLRGSTLEHSMTTQEAADVLARERHHGLAVVDDGRLVGIVTLTDIARRGGPSADTTVGQVMTERPVTVVPTMPVSAALARMAALEFGRLPVVSDDDPRLYVGMFRRESVVRGYHRALAASMGRQMYRDRSRLRSQPEASFYELPVPTRSGVDGASVRSLAWPDGATLVSVRRGTRVIIPHGDTVLRPGDVITVFGTGDSRVELAFMLEPAIGPAESATHGPVT